MEMTKESIEKTREGFARRKRMLNLQRAEANRMLAAPDMVTAGSWKCGNCMNCTGGKCGDLLFGEGNLPDL